MSKLLPKLSVIKVPVAKIKKEANKKRRKHMIQIRSDVSNRLDGSSTAKLDCLDERVQLMKINV